MKLLSNRTDMRKLYINLVRKNSFFYFRLAKIWEEMFSTQFFDDFSIEECPLLIGIMRLFEHKIDGLVTSEYEFKTLVKGDTLIRTEMTVNCENLLNELDIFNSECDKNQQDLVSIFSCLFSMKNICFSHLISSERVVFLWTLFLK